MKNKRLIDFQEGREKPGMADVHSSPVLDDLSASAVAHIEQKVPVQDAPREPEPRVEKRPDTRQRSAQLDYQRFKRVMDIIISVVALTIFGLLLPIIALAIKLDSRGPVFFSQDRIGMNRRRRRRGDFGDGDQRKVLQPGRPFRIIKLRTMCED
ncbi:MAG: sugar transferase, partial [bacterium]